MEIIAQPKFVRQTPRKLRLVADEIRGLTALEAEIVLKSLNKKAAKVLLKVLKQGMANAENNFDLKKENLEIKRLEIGEGPRIKSHRFVAKGRIHQILKRMSHVRMILNEKEEKVEKVEKAEKIKTKEKKDEPKR